MDIPRSANAALDLAVESISASPIEPQETMWEGNEGVESLYCARGGVRGVDDGGVGLYSARTSFGR